MKVNKPLGWNGFNYSLEETRDIVETYTRFGGTKKTPWLQELADRLDRPKSNISRYARQLGLTRATGNKKPCTVCGKLTLKKKFCNKECQKSTYPPRKTHNKMGSPEQRARAPKNLKARWQDKSDPLNSEKHRQARSDRMSALMTRKIQERPTSIYSRTKKGWVDFRSGKRYYFKSGWEMRYASHLEMLLKGGAIKDWTYEEDTFWFEHIKRGVRSYTPDFKIYFHDGSVQYHEVKGWMDNKSKTKLKRMAKYYPDITLTVIGEEEMKKI